MLKTSSQRHRSEGLWEKALRSTGGLSGRGLRPAEWQQLTKMGRHCFYKQLYILHLYYYIIYIWYHLIITCKKCVARKTQTVATVAIISPVDKLWRGQKSTELAKCHCRYCRSASSCFSRLCREGSLTWFFWGSTAEMPIKMIQEKLCENNECETLRESSAAKKTF